MKPYKRPEIVKYSTKKGEGTGLVEAPRGLLIHHYQISEGLVAKTDIITPTAQNAEDIERYCQIGAQKLIDNNQEELITKRVEQVVRAFDPCFSCSVHMAEIKHAPKSDWKRELNHFRASDNPVFVGLGRSGRSDDGAGLELAQRLQSTGNKSVCVETESGEIQGLEKIPGASPLIFMDAVDFKEKPGKITLLPLSYILNNSALSHKFQPFVSLQKNALQLTNSYILAIQPETIAEGEEMSPAVLKAIDSIVKHMEN